MAQKIEIKVPAMGESISEATVGELLKTSGSQVNMNDEILELETEKVNQALYAQQAGVINWTVASGDIVKIGQVIGTIDTNKEAPVVVEKPAEVKAPVPEKKVEEKAAAAPVVASEGNARVGKDEFIKSLSADNKPKASQQATSAPKAVPSSPKAVTDTRKDGNETRRKMTKIRQVIAKRLVESQQTAAMLTTFNEVDMTEVMNLREKYKDAFLKKHGVKLGFMSFFVKACVDALMQFPDFNSYIDGDEIIHREYYDIGIAVGTDRGLVVPVVRNCNLLSFPGIESAIEGFAKKAKDGTLSIEEMQGGGFTITNGGVYGSLLSTPILNPPQPGILGMHKILKRPVAINDQVVIRPMMYVALSYDHRLVDGKGAVSFLVKVKELLEDPVRMELDV